MGHGLSQGQQRHEQLAQYLGLGTGLAVGTDVTAVLMEKLLETRHQRGNKPMTETFSTSSTRSQQVYA